MQDTIDVFCSLSRYHLGDLFNGCLFEFCNTTKFFQQQLFPFWAYPFNLIENGFCLCLGSQLSMITDGSAVDFILHACQKEEQAGITINRYNVAIGIH